MKKSESSIKKSKNSERKEENSPVIKKVLEISSNLSDSQTKSCNIGNEAENLNDVDNVEVLVGKKGGINLDKWQEEVLEYKGDIGLCTGRRVGKTYILSRKAIDHMVKYGKPIIVVSLTEDQAMIIIQMALRYARETYPKMIGKGRYKPQLKKLFIMRDKKPVEMLSRPVGNTGDATRGFEGGVLIVDEASRMPRLFWIAALPVLLTCAGEIWMCSTPFGKKGYFWDRFNEAVNLKEPKARFKFIYQNTEDVVRDRPISESWTKEQREGAIKILEDDKKDMSEMEYGQEYQGLFLDELRQFFSDEWIEKVCTLPQNTPTTSGGDLFLGVDVGRVNDPSTFEILNGTDEDHIKQVYNDSKTKLSIPATFEEMRRLERSYSFNRIGVDSGGMGAGVLDLLLRDEDTKRKSEGLDNATKPIDADGKEKPLLKEEMYVNLLTNGEMGKIKLFDNPEIIASLRSIQYEYLEKKMKIFGNNSHITEGLIRANQLIKQKLLKPFITHC